MKWSVRLKGCYNNTYWYHLMYLQLLKYLLICIKHEIWVSCWLVPSHNWLLWHNLSKVIEGVENWLCMANYPHVRVWMSYLMWLNKKIVLFTQQLFRKFEWLNCIDITITRSKVSWSKGWKNDVQFYEDEMAMYIISVHHKLS